MEDLKLELDKIVENHKGTYLDALWIGIMKPSSMGWREAKKLGMEKDFYYGWMFYSTSTNSNGNDLLEKIQKVCSPYDMRIRTYDL